MNEFVCDFFQRMTYHGQPLGMDQNLTLSKDQARPDVLTNLPLTDAQWLSEKLTFMPDPPLETFLTSHDLNGLRQKGCPVLVKNWIFDDSFHKKLPVMFFFGASDDKTIRIRKFLEEIGL